ncbi:hypothetical protein EHH44_11510 [Mycolicibacter terrae]|uniref:Uncharacterized protein n=1 Tax=Mycolicibacter terrae TaxID=1788 RepID=A0ACD2EMX1_9MYCO|nr:hypothetical protein EHH44_11510 [Mycolicibacter terrae]
MSSLLLLLIAPHAPLCIVDSRCHRCCSSSSLRTLRSASSTADVIAAAPPHRSARSALHRRQQMSSLLLLLIAPHAPLCIVDSRCHRCSSSLRSESAW